MFGNAEYEYTYVINKEGIEKLKKVLNNDDILNALEGFFHGEMLNTEFTDLLKENKIEYHVFVL